MWESKFHTKNLAQFLLGVETNLAISNMPAGSHAFAAYNLR
jgi:hypothetical protein